MTKPTKPAEQPSPEQLVGRVVSLTALLSAGIAGSGEDDDVILMTLYIFTRALENGLTRTYNRNRPPGSPPAKKMLKSIRDCSRGITQLLHQNAETMIPGYLDMTEEQIRQMTALLNAGDDIPRA